MKTSVRKTPRDEIRSRKQAAMRRDLTRFKRILRQHLPELQTRYGVKSLGIFGSYVRGEARKNSDLDVLVEFESAPSLFKFVELKEYLAQLLGIKVDLVMKSALKPSIGQRIIMEVVPV